MDVNDITGTVVEQHKIQLESSGVPKHLWPAVFRKLNEQIYDAGHFFYQVCHLIEENEVGNQDVSRTVWEVVLKAPEGMKAGDFNSVFLIDHAWTYRAYEAQNHLETIPGLVERMAALMDINSENKTQEFLVDAVLKEMWKYNGTYSVGNTSVEEQVPLWYIMDEFGSRIQHDRDANCRIIPFYYVPHQCCYSLLFPIKDIYEGEEVTRNYLEGPETDVMTREALMLPWFPEDLTHIEPTQSEPPFDFFTSSRLVETLPEHVTALPLSTSNGPIQVYSDYEYIQEYLTDKRFTIVSDQDDADIIWISSHFKDFMNLSRTPEKRINQFPFEHLVTVKDLLAVVCRRALQKGQKNCGITLQNEKVAELISDLDSKGTSCADNQSCAEGPLWFPTTFCLKREVPLFVSNFQRREKRKLDNHWIIKPWNLARGLDITVTNNLSHILRLTSTGPKIAQKYVENPVLFYRDDLEKKVKFDLRFIVMLLSVQPLKVAVYERFWIRFANEEFELKDLENYQKHFTVNNYNDAGLLQMYCHDFIVKFNEQYPETPWCLTEKKIYQMFHEVFKSATVFDPPRGIPHNPQCKGSYGFDVMISWGKDSSGRTTMEPQLLEVNFNSDCKRACEYYSEFFNDLFAVMFLDETEKHNVTLL